jgi:hypothetical protein
MNAKSLLTTAALAVGISLFAPAVPASPPPAGEPGSATLTVTVVAKKGPAPAVAKDDVQLSAGKDRQQMAKWVKDAKIYLSIGVPDGTIIHHHIR